MDWRNKTVVLVALSLLGTGCFTPEPKLLTSENPDSKIPAIKDAADHNDRAAIPKLIAALESEDSAIRFAAITALQRMTGQTMDYRFYDDPPQRRPAVDRWKQWLALHPSP